jgi:hypothetical protein
MSQAIKHTLGEFSLVDQEDGGREESQGASENEESPQFRR